MSNIWLHTLCKNKMLGSSVIYGLLAMENMSNLETQKYITLVKFVN
jgi:hypothetical protein